MQKYNVTIGSLTESDTLVTFKGIEVEDRETAGLVALRMMAVPELWAVSSIVTPFDVIVRQIRSPDND